jgi:zinc and cadmium transporter
VATISQVIFFSLIGGIFSLIGGIMLLARKKSTEKILPYVTAFAAGALLAAVFLDLLPEGMHVGEPENVLTAALVGVLAFFMAERFLRWFHHHHVHSGQQGATKSLIVVGDLMHNALDGVAIAAGFLVSVPTGIVTTIAVAAHEIPQEIGDFGLLLSKGMQRKNVLLINIITALATTVFAVATFLLGSADALPVDMLLGLSAGFLLYIAMSDVIPSIHSNGTAKKLFDWRPVMLLVGVVLVGSVINLAHGYIGDDHGHGGHDHDSSLQEGHAHEEDEHHDDEDHSHEDDDHHAENDHYDDSDHSH